VVLIDEFEKSDPTARNVLLKIFNDGWAQDGRGRVVSFSGTYFILTANAGHRLWQRVRKKIGFGLDSPPPQATGPSEEQIREVLLREGVTPELLSRISEVVLFKALGVNELKEIARRRFNRLRESALLEDLVVLEYDEKDLAEWVVKRTGLHQDCRRLTAVLKSEIETPLAYWRLGRKNRKFDVVRLATNSERIEIREETGKKEEAVEQVLFARVAALYKQKEERRRNEQSLRLLLGTSS
jgi:ATP-dependent Clp protease ATP-binding subunit ClpA